MTAATAPRTRFATTATYADIKTFITDLTGVMMPELSEWSAHETNHVLVVYTNGIADAIDWCDAFGVPDDHRTGANVVDQGKRVYSGFVAWRGWHVMVHGSDLLAGAR